MNAELLKAWAEAAKATASSIGIVGGLIILWRSLERLFASGNPFSVKVGQILTIETKPGEKTITPVLPASDSPEAALLLASADVLGMPAMGNQPAENTPDLPPIRQDAPIPSDYIYLIHTSFLRPEKQREFQARTGVALTHYDIRVKTESYYQGAADRISYVEYVLHKSFPDPIQRRYSQSDGFQLKEIANGEFVLAARIYLKDKREPLVLQRFITLWPSGPQI